MLLSSIPRLVLPLVSQSKNFLRIVLARNFPEYLPATRCGLWLIENKARGFWGC